MPCFSFAHSWHVRRYLGHCVQLQSVHVHVPPSWQVHAVVLSHPHPTSFPWASASLFPPSDIANPTLAHSLARPQSPLRLLSLPSPLTPLVEFVLKCATWNPPRVAPSRFTIISHTSLIRGICKEHAACMCRPLAHLEDWWHITPATVVELPRNQRLNSPDVWASASGATLHALGSAERVQRAQEGR